MRLLILVSVVTARWPKLVPWLRQRTTITGLAVLFGVLVALLDGSITWLTALPGLGGALVMVLIPEHPAASTTTTKLLTDLLLLLDPVRRVEAVGRLGSDLADVADAVGGSARSGDGGSTAEVTVAEVSVATATP